MSRGVGGGGSGGGRDSRWRKIIGDRGGGGVCVIRLLLTGLVRSVARHLRRGFPSSGPLSESSSGSVEKIQCLKKRCLKKMGGQLSKVINTGAKEKSRSFGRLAESAESEEVM